MVNKIKAPNFHGRFLQHFAFFLNQVKSSPFWFLPQKGPKDWPLLFAAKGMRAKSF